MSSSQQTKFIYLNCIYFEVAKFLSPYYNDKQLKVDFMPPNRIKILNWSQENPICKNFKQNYSKIISEVSIIKINQPTKKIQRIRFMKKWKQQFQIPVLNIILVKKDFGHVYYLMGCTSQQQLYNVMKNMQKHSYKTYSGNFVKFLYKPALQALISCKDYQIQVYQKLKVTSTEMKLTTVQSQNKKKAKFVQLLFQLQDYIQTVDLIEKFKFLITNEYFMCSLVIEKENLESITDILEQSGISAWKIQERRRQDRISAYIVIKIKDAKTKFNSIMSKCEYVNSIAFLKGIGPSHELLLSYHETRNCDVSGNSSNYLLTNFFIKGNSEKNPNQILLTKKENAVDIGWNQISNYIINDSNNQ